MLGNYLQQTTSADDIFRCIFFLGALGLNRVCFVHNLKVLILGVLCLVLVLLFSTLSPSCFCNPLDWEERAGCFALTVTLMSYVSQCSVAIPRVAVGWSDVCDCGIS